jgi:hypothetical protein
MQIEIEGIKITLQKHPFLYHYATRLFCLVIQLYDDCSKPFPEILDEGF